MTFSWSTFLLQALNFVVLAYLLHRLLYKPLRRAVEQRREATERAATEAKNARQEALALQQQLQDRLAEVERSRQETIHQAREQAAVERRKMLDDAEQEARQHQEEARQAFQRERAEELQALHSEIVGQAIELTRRLLSEAVDQTLHQQLIMRLLAALQSPNGKLLPESEKEQLRTRWQPEDGVLLETAQELDEASLEKVKEAVTAFLGRSAQVTVEVKPALLGGGRLRIAGHVWDGSLAGQLQEVRP